MSTADGREALVQAAMKAVDLAGLDPGRGMTLRACVEHLLDDGHLVGVVAGLAYAAEFAREAADA